ncbi:MAG TPA: hypothetical protein EYM50_00145, partial [Nitrososphaerales archaeon]|nr:hypothetical protein [Nitrososphaerales archaeon]
MRLLKLQLTIIGTMGLLIGLSTLIFSIILLMLGGTYNIGFIIVLVGIFHLFQWGYGPKMVEKQYKVRELKKTDSIPCDNPEIKNISGQWIYDTVERICKSANMPVPKIMYSDIALPNAFAYSSPKYGKRIAITRGLAIMNDPIVELEEIEAIIGHELGHIKHKDVEVMMVASFLPAILTMIGHSLIWSSIFNRRNSGGMLAIAFAAIIGSFILGLVCKSLGRRREEYADMFARQHVKEGGRKLQEGLVKIVENQEKLRLKKHKDLKISGFNTLMISNPDSSHKDIVSLQKSRIKLS